MRAYYVPLVLALLLASSLYGGALIAQYIFGLPPCPMCYWQRWPHQVAIVLSAAGLLGSYWRYKSGTARVQTPQIIPIVTIIVAIAIATSGAIGVFHAGVEYGWWQGPTQCTPTSVGAGITGFALDDLLAAPIVRCDVAPWQLGHLSLAGYNALFSLTGAVWILYLLRSKK